MTHNDFHSRLQIVLADRVENVECSDRVVQRHDMMFHSAGDAIHLAWTEDAIFLADEKMGTPFQNHADLFVRMRVWLHDRFRLERDQAKHHLAARGRFNLNTGKNLMP